MSYVLPDPGPPNAEFAQPADLDRLERTAEALQGRGFRAHVVADGAAAKQFVLDAIPEGAEVHTALSETLTELGIRAEIEESGRYDSVRAKLALLDRETQDREMRKLGAAPDYIVGSAHAITDDGVVMVGSGSGSQLGAYAYAAGRVILVVGHQKLVRDIPAGCAASASTHCPASSRACRPSATPAACSPRPCSSSRSRAAGSSSSSSRRHSASDPDARSQTCAVHSVDPGTRAGGLRTHWLTGRIAAMHLKGAG